MIFSMRILQVQAYYINNHTENVSCNYDKEFIWLVQYQEKLNNTKLHSVVL